jgi:hypothetical protein
MAIREVIVAARPNYIAMVTSMDTGRLSAAEAVGSYPKKDDEVRRYEPVVMCYV